LHLPPIQYGGAHGQAHIAADRFHFGDRTHCFNNAGKHTFDQETDFSAKT
jgi:hypothetical protein